MERDLRIAVFGQKRLSREGGVEIVVKELCTRMARQGCQVTCYNRSGHHVSGAEYDDIDNTNYEGIRQKCVPTIEKKGARDIIWATRKNPDFILLIPRFRENAAAFTTLLAELCSMMLCIRCSRGLVTVSADRRTVGSVLCGCVGIVLVCTGVKALALPNLICILAAVLGSVAAYAAILLGMKNPLVLEYLEKAKQKFRKTS